MKKYYITAAIPYVNAKPHIGHTLELIEADVLARYHKLLGEETLYLCGADENSLKNVQAAEAEGISAQELVDRNAKYFEDLFKNLNTTLGIFQKGSDQKNHYPSSQKLWKLCDEAGDIYKKSYKGLYCVGCEQFYTKEELNEKGECFEHPGKPVEEVEEENYFFRLSKYQDALIKLIESGDYQIIPATRKNEVLSFLKQPLQDISISRSNERAKNWGIPVPGDPTQRIYVWFDALNIYQSGIGFGWDEEKYQKWWPADLHVIGKGIIRFHAVYWPAFLLSAKLKLPKKLLVHDYVTIDGQKISKSIGNVIDPNDYIEKYGADALRYYLLAKISPFSDGDFTEEKFKETYNADLANGLGNLVARVAKLCENNNLSFRIDDPQSYSINSDVEEKIKEYKFNEALSLIWDQIREADRLINETRPWEYGVQKLTAITESEKLHEILDDLWGKIIQIAYNLKPFLPETADKILEQFTGGIKSSAPLFPRI